MSLPADLDRRFEAVVVCCGTPRTARELAKSFRLLTSAGVLVGVVVPLAVEEITNLLDSGRGSADLVLADSRGSGDAVIATLDELWRRGVGPRDVLLLIDDPQGAGLCRPIQLEHDLTVASFEGGISDLRHLLADQLRHRSRHALPRSADRDGWSLAVEGFDPEHERVDEALVSLADGHIGTSGSSIAPHPSRNPWVIASGVYDGDGAESDLLLGPKVFELTGMRAGIPQKRVLDLRTGVLHELTNSEQGAFESVRFASVADPGTSVLRAHCPKGFRSGPAVMAPVSGRVHDSGRSGSASWVRVAGSSGGIVTAATQVRSRYATLDRFGTYQADSFDLPDPHEAIGALERAGASGFDRLLTRHRHTWARRWEEADVVVEGDDELQLGIRLALYQLMASVADSGEAAVGARGLTGRGYRGHVFWDADVFILPFLSATHPAAARAILEYRARRLPAAIEAALADGRSGARFPWESALTGEDVTPTSVRDPTGKIVRVRTGQLEEHIVADVSWAAVCYFDWSGDEEFAAGAGRRILVETARYWASRVQLEPDGTAHIYGVIGPDEYHEDVDDNAYTNVMARWNLRRAAATAGSDDVSAEERSRWLGIADSLVDGYDSRSGIYEQFAGFEELEPLIIAEVVPRRPIAADLLLGAERVAGAQVVKQADVLMLHHLVPDEVVPGSLAPNLHYYEPRTAHGSSLSPAVHASLHARAGDFDKALTELRLAARMDLDDLSGFKADGLHLATMGGLWQALAFGFAGLRPRGEMLQVDPVLPSSWSALELRLQFLGSRLLVRFDHSGLSIDSDRSTVVLVGGTRFSFGPGKLEFRHEGSNWVPVAQ